MKKLRPIAASVAIAVVASVMITSCAFSKNKLATDRIVKIFEKAGYEEVDYDVAIGRSDYYDDIFTIFPSEYYDDFISELITNTEVSDYDIEEVFVFFPSYTDSSYWSIKLDSEEAAEEFWEDIHDTFEAAAEDDGECDAGEQDGINYIIGRYGNSTVCWGYYQQGEYLFLIHFNELLTPAAPLRDHQSEPVDLQIDGVVGMDTSTETQSTGTAQTQSAEDDEYDELYAQWEEDVRRYEEGYEESFNNLSDICEQIGIPSPADL